MNVPIACDTEAAQTITIANKPKAIAMQKPIQRPMSRKKLTRSLLGADRL